MQMFAFSWQIRNKEHKYFFYLIFDGSPNAYWKLLKSNAIQIDSIHIDIEWH